MVGGRSLTLRHGDELVEHPPQRYEDDGRASSSQTCRFDNAGNTGWDRPYLNAGPGRLPTAHTLILDYCERLKVPLEVYVMETRAGLTRGSGKSFVNRHLVNDARGWIAQELYERVGDLGLRDDQKKALREMLRVFGALGETGHYAREGRYERPGPPRAGYLRLPGVEPGRDMKPIPLEEVLASGFWNNGTYQPEDWFWQPSLLQPVGGMDRIEERLREDVTKLGGTIRLSSPVQRILFDTSAKQWVVVPGGGPLVRADVCISNIPAPLLEPLIDAETMNRFPESFRRALQTIFAMPAGRRGFLGPTCKVGWQARRELWQKPSEDRVAPIYGGISRTDHPMSQIWYPSDRFEDELGVLTGAYNARGHAEDWGRKSPSWRVEQAREGARQLAGERFARGLDKGISIAWQNMRYLRGGWAQWQNVRDGVKTYNALIHGDHERNFFICGDQASQLPGWKEGAVASALYVLEMLLTPATAFEPVEVQTVPDSRILVEGFVPFDDD